MYLLHKEILLSTCLLLLILYCSPSSSDSSGILTDGNGSGVGARSIADKQRYFERRSSVKV